MKSRQNNGRDSRSRETEVGEKIAVTIRYSLSQLIVNAKKHLQYKTTVRPSVALVWDLVETCVHSSKPDSSISLENFEIKYQS